MSTVKTHEQQPVSPGSFHEFQQQAESQQHTQTQPLIDNYTQALAEGNFQGSFEEFSASYSTSEETVATSALSKYTKALQAFRDSRIRSLPTQA